MNNVKFVYVKSLPSGPFSELKYMHACVCRKKRQLARKKILWSLEKSHSLCSNCFHINYPQRKGKKGKRVVAREIDFEEESAEDHTTTTTSCPSKIVSVSGELEFILIV